MNAGELSRQAGLVIQLVDSIVGLLVESNSRHYPGGTALFRDYVLKLGEATEVYVSGVVTAGSNEPKHVQSLATLTRLWRSLHTFVKPIADSHSLTYPYSLIEAFASILRSLETFGFSELQVAVFHTADFNYLQLQTSSLMNLSETIKGVIPGAPSFPQGLVLVGLPYSQQGSVDLNTLLMHELGHFVYQTVSDPRAKIVQCLEKLEKDGELAEILEKSEDDQSWCFQMFRQWIEELYADLFAVEMIGPAFTYAFTDFIDSTLLSRASDELYEFGPSHPADAYRLRQQYALLEKRGWWKHFSAIDNPVLPALKKLSQEPLTQFSYTGGRQNLAELAMKLFFQVAEQLDGLCFEQLGVATTSSAEFEKLGEAVERYLSRGVVPSTLNIGGIVTRPSEATLINASRRFNLAGLKTLLDNFDPPQSLNARTYAKWSRRVESWILKALEDVELLKES